MPDDQVFTIMDAIADSCEPLIIPDISMRDIGDGLLLHASSKHRGR
ncbi:hypothetical protein [Bifidobacterium callitrichidarum]|nr:hypothetical protein [Bifidobacterium callitrichidarum]